VTVSTINVPDMHCSACSSKIRAALANLTGVEATYFNPSRRQVLVEHEADIGALELLKRIESAGFNPVLSGVEFHDEQQKELLKRLGIAGLSMMQVMMAAVALYSGALSGMDEAYRRLLEYTSLIFCIPVIGYSAMPFFIGALKAVRTGINMDVPIALAISIAFGTSLNATLSGTGEVYYDSVVMFTFLLLGARYIDSRLQQRFSSTSASLAGLPMLATRLTAGVRESVRVPDISPGEHLWVGEGDQIPVDGQLQSAAALTDEALLSGESDWVRKHHGDTLWAGSVNRGAGFEMTSSAAVDASRIADIATLADRAALERTPTAVLADRVAAWFIPTILLLATATFCVWHIIEPARALVAALTVLVVSCPCALSLATPAALTAAMTRLRDAGAVFTRSAALEQLATIDLALIDKTGTLTVHEPKLQNTELLDDHFAEARVLELAGALQQHSAHPYAKAFPTTAAVHLSDVQVVTGSGVRGVWDDRTQQHSVRIGSAGFCGSAAAAGAATDDDRAVYLTVDDRLVARFLISDEVRADAHQAIRRLRELNIRPIMLSGDSEQRCRELACVLGIDYLSRQTPETKLDYLRAQSAAGHRTLMLGDGINDVPVLAGADVSATVLEASDLVKSKADVLLLTRRLAPLPELITVARRTMTITRQNLFWALAYNLTAIPIAAMGWMPPWLAALGMASSSTLVMFNATRILR